MLDLYCKAGGAAMGYHRAGFCLVGVDIERQRRYPFRFVQADALDALAHWDLSRFSAIHASPPCQAYSATRTMHNARHDHPELVEPTRELLQRSGLPWVMENVPGSPLIEHVILCGTMFDLRLASGEYELRRHRLFEVSGFYCLTPQCAHGGRVLGVRGGGARKNRRALGVLGHGGGSVRDTRWGQQASLAEAKELMRIEWMTRSEISQAIPPAYTEYLGRALLDQLPIRKEGL